jgi:uncharacterized protein with HEPN domain
MRHREWQIRIRDILHAAQKTILHTQTMAFDQFAKDEWIVDAVLRNLTVIGEAARHIPDEICVQYHEIPWQDIRDMRNIVVHEYFGVDLAMVWLTVTQDLPALVAKLEPLLKSDK